jgi:RecB family endonuclease NucS
MSDRIALQKTATGWEFRSEAALEDFARQNLQQLLGLSVLRGQYYISGQVCDLLAVDQNKGLTVVELKNSEDRYIVQQLTRYYDALEAAKPDLEGVDYTQPIHLVAIAPSFHRDSFIDRKYSHLQIQFLQLALLEDEKNLYFQLRNLDNEAVWVVAIPHPLEPQTVNVPSPPKALLNLLAKCTAEERQGILALREQILQFDGRMQECIDAGGIQYGRGKGKPCAQVRFDKIRNSAALFLWLPHVSGSYKRQSIVARMRIWTDWSTVSDLGHVPKGCGRMISRSEWQSGICRPLNKILPKQPELKEKYFTDSAYRERLVNSNKHLCNRTHYKSGLAMSFGAYTKHVEASDVSNRLTHVTNLALETWLKRL